MTGSISPRELRDRLIDRQEVIIVDPREEGSYSTSPHILQSINIPLSRLELRVADLLPRLGTPIVVVAETEDDDAVICAAQRLAGWGYTGVRVLAGGLRQWAAAGFPLYTGFNTFSKAFGEFIEHSLHTPSIDADELKRRMQDGDDILIVDSRTPQEHHRGTIPGSISVPGAELGLRVPTMLSHDSTLVVVNCAGRTRSIIGAQSLIDLRLNNPVRALRNGTMGWKLAGFDLETSSLASMPSLDPNDALSARESAERVMARFGIGCVGWREYLAWRDDEAAPCCYLLDVRTQPEYVNAHPRGAIHAQGGQLVQATDGFIASTASRVVLFDDYRLRAAMTASWLKRMGISDVHVLREDDPEIDMAAGMPVTAIDRFVDQQRVKRLSADALLAMREPYSVFDLGRRRSYIAAHIPGALWTVRAQLAQAIEKARPHRRIVLTSDDERIAMLAAHDIQDNAHFDVFVLEGGNDAWVQAGYPVAHGMEVVVCEAEDEFIKPMEAKNQRESMSQYLSWEVGILETVMNDPTVHFARLRSSPG